MCVTKKEKERRLDDLNLLDKLCMVQYQGHKRQQRHMLGGGLYGLRHFCNIKIYFPPTWKSQNMLVMPEYCWAGSTPVEDCGLRNFANLARAKL